MGLTRAQLLMGDNRQGSVLAGQVQAIKKGRGIVISPTGVISVDATTLTDFVRVNNPDGFNNYVWPTTPGTVGEQLTLSSGNQLIWKESDGIPWTVKGQLIVATGIDTDTLLNPGVDGSVLVADFSSSSGLNYTSNYVATTGPQGAAQAPAGLTTQRPSLPSIGQFRYNTTDGAFEFYGSGGWVLFGVGTVTDVDASGGTTGLSFTGGPVTTTGILTLGGTLGIANGGTNATTRLTAINNLLPSQIGRGGNVLSTDGSNAIWTPVSGTGTVTSIDVSGGTTGVTFTGGPITGAGIITMGGTLSISNGGTNASNPNSALNNLLPNQSGQNGKVLSTDGSNTSWTTVGGVGTITGVTAGIGLSGGGTSGNVTLSNTGVTQLTAGSNITLSGTTGNVLISASGGGGGGTITGVTAGSGLSGGGTSGTVTLTNTGVTQLTAGTNISLSATTGNILISASGGGGGVTSVDVSGGSTGLTTSGGPITTSGTITLGGTLGIANGGTGANSKVWVDLTTNQSIAGIKSFTSPAGIFGQGFNDVSGTTSGFGFVGSVLTAQGDTQANLVVAVNTFFSANAILANIGSAGTVNISSSTNNNVVNAAWIVGSDQRWKTAIYSARSNIVDEYYEAFKNLNFCTYKFKPSVVSAEAAAETRFGLIAQEALACHSDFVKIVDLSNPDPTDTDAIGYAAHMYADTHGISGDMERITQAVLQKTILDLEALRSEFDAYVLAHPQT